MVSEAYISFCLQTTITVSFSSEEEGKTQDLCTLWNHCHNSCISIARLSVFSCNLSGSMSFFDRIDLPSSGTTVTKTGMLLTLLYHLWVCVLFMALTAIRPAKLSRVGQTESIEIR